MEAPKLNNADALPDLDGPAHRVFPARGGTGRPVFLVHGLCGTVMECRPLLGHLRSNRPIHGFHARGVDDGLAPLDRVEDLANDYVRQMRHVQPSGPYAVWGFSFGGLVALEMAQLLVAAGERVEHVGLIDTYFMQSLHGWAARVERAKREVRYLRHSTWRQKVLRLQAHGRPPAPLCLPAPLRGVYDAMERAFLAYEPRPFDSAPLAYVRAAVPLGGRYVDPLPALRRIAGPNLRVLKVPGAHLDLVGAASLHAARAIDTVLEAATDGSGDESLVAVPGGRAARI